MSRYEKVSRYILPRLEKELSSKLHYHNIDHVMDVLKSAEALAEAENVTGLELELLKVAVLFHDSGFLIHSKDHEIIGCDIAREHLPAFGYNKNEISIVCDLILATRIPQSPRRHLEKIICDADLDYLGRDDFYTTGDKVYLEFKEMGIVNSRRDWNEMQVSFLSSHNYFTNTSIKLRKENKLAHLEKVKQLIKADA